MFCPQCKAEYRLGFIRCNDCDIGLVDYLPQDAVHSKDAGNSGYVEVATVQRQMEADQICSFLEANGIPVVIEGEPFRNVYEMKISGEKALHIMVPQELTITALDLLARADRGELAINSADDEGSAP
jgi:hypothetical protein